LLGKKAPSIYGAFVILFSRITGDFYPEGLEGGSNGKGQFFKQINN
jgi:hypothetical protein